MIDQINAAYVDGKDAYYDDKPIKDNPHSATFEYELYSAWCRGYIEAEVEKYAMA